MARASVVVAAMLVLLGATSAPAATWSTQTTQNASGAEHSILSEVACEPSSTNSCTAVGKSTAAGVGRPLAEYWNGGTWSVQTAPAPASATESELRANACATTTSCLAVGFYRTATGQFTLAETWNGREWSIQATPTPAGATEVRLNGVSCSSSTGCSAVGYTIVGGVRAAFAMRWNGTSWASQTIPLPAGTSASELEGVDCVSASYCTTVGRYTESGGRYWPLVLRYSSPTWALQTATRPAGSLRGVFLDVDCTEASECTAVGAYRNEREVQVSLAERWNGSTWAVQSTPNPATSLNTVLQNVACAGEQSCTAVGDWLDGARWSTLAESWNGAEWFVETTPNRASATFDILDSVSCRDLTCIAVGWATVEGRDVTTGAIRRVTNWSEWAIPSYVFNEDTRGIACTATNNCLVVGEAEYVTNWGEGPIIEIFARVHKWNGISWSISGNPEPSGAPWASELHDISCTASNACTAVGAYEATSGTPARAYAARWNGTSWSSVVVPAPASTRTSVLRDVACTSAEACIAVGSYTTEAGVTQTMAQRWNGTTWSIQSTPTGGASSSQLRSISCTSGSACVAAGTATVEGRGQSLAMHWNGASWSIVSTPLPAGATAGEFHGVSCTSESACTAVGTYTEALGGSAYASRWNGTSWSAQWVPNPPFTQGAVLQDVACASATACTAVGFQTEAGGLRRTVGAGWDGTRWELHRTPSPGTSASYLTGVMCFSSTSCRANGYKEGGANRENIAAVYP